MDPNQTLPYSFSNFLHLCYFFIGADFVFLCYVFSCKGFNYFIIKTLNAFMILLFF